MVKIDFNDESFKGFSVEEDILVDTGIILAYLSKYDTWHKTVNELFTNHIFNNDKAVFLYINPCILNEVMHITTVTKKCISEYLKKHPEISLTKQEKEEIESNTVQSMKILIDKEILIPLEAGKETYLKQIETCKYLGSADAFNASLANEYGISFLTVDNKLVTNIENNITYFKDIDKIYYTTNAHIEY